VAAELHRNAEENINSKELDYTFLSLISEKIKVLIVGGGRAGFIKAKSFSSSSCNVWIVSKEFCDDFNQLRHLSNVNMICSLYNTEYLLDKHIIVAATGDEETDKQVASDCEKYAKLYLFCSDYRKGNLIKPLQRETKSIIFSLHSKSGNPNASLFSASLTEENLAEYDDFITYINSLRYKLKNNSCKNEIMKFVSTRDFHFFYKNNAADMVLDLFYPELKKEE
jgi:precorrin-2 dehydrogenase/sirohydrochlorin ferrochelatase